MAETKKIVRQSLTNLSSLALQQIGVRNVVDPDLNFKMWGGKDDSGSVTYFLAKDQAGQLTTLKLTDASIATGSAGIITHSATGVLTGDADINKLSDVDITSPANGEVLLYNSTNSAWENSAMPLAMLYKGTWNASTNTPTLGSGGSGGVQGDYYIVSVAGTTTIDGESDWEIGDWIVHNGSTWDKIDNTEPVVTFDDCYNYDSGERTITVDDGSVAFYVEDTYDFVIDCSSSEDPVSNGTTVPYGFKIENGADSWNVGYLDTDQILFYGEVQNYDLNVGSALTIDAGGTISISATGSIAWSGSNASLSGAGDLSLLGTGSQIILENNTQTSGNVTSIISTPGSASTAILLNLEAQGTNWGSGARVINIVTDDNDAIPFNIDNGGGSVYQLSRSGGISMDGNITLSAGGNIVSTSNGDVSIIPNGTGIFMCGTGSPGHLTPTSGEAYFGDKVEVDGILFCDKGVYLENNYEISRSASSYGAFYGRITAQTVDAAFLTTGITGNYIALCEDADRAFDWSFAQQTTPTLYMTGATQNTTYWGSLTFNDTDFMLDAGAGTIRINRSASYTPDAITATSETVAASVATVITEITTNGDSDLDDVSLANGVDGQIKIFSIVAVGNAADSVKITPASMIGGTQITFAASPLGLGCIMCYDAGVGGWVVVANNGGTIS